MLYEDKIKMAKKIRIESATFQRLLTHFRENPDIQNIDLMNLANFCRNCISKWYVTESENLEEKINYDEAREIIYGMTYLEYKKKYQKEATKEQLEKFNENKKKNNH